MGKESCPRDWFPGSEEVSTGTTLVAVEFADGVVIGADSRTSMGTWVANRVTDKLTPVTDSVFCCRSGSDCCWVRRSAQTGAGVVCANWRHVRASADDYWWLWILLPLWHDGPHIQGQYAPERVRGFGSAGCYPGNQERRQLWRMLQDGNYHQGWRGEEAVVEQRAAHQVLSWDSRPSFWRTLLWPKPPTLM